ncbi:hypothetical protein [Geobacter sp. SVR]|uniref:hypothetical protein n=1 Tax=Geobacter sp. SVR TaxID=2495594 RepID=UPI00143F0562|nr:hypothetical protein [Geobacter sp. SVR]BCS54142.1 hypothetical protein GSVR_24500 [Geobacter sp. SVR]GCF87704.1 hypothetical protein GSbR_43040 [Geobacter sp. SVR]
MRKEKALLLKEGSLVVAGSEIMRVIGTPELHVWYGSPVARVTAADAYYRTRVFVHDEIESIEVDAAA